jgi:hypothetical protein
MDLLADPAKTILRMTPGRQETCLHERAHRPGIAGDACAFTAAASLRAGAETLTRSLRAAFSPAAAFGADFALTIPDTTRTETIPADPPGTAKALKTGGGEHQRNWPGDIGQFARDYASAFSG